MRDIPDPRRVIPSGATKKEIVLAVLVALLVIGLVGFAVVYLGNNSVQTAVSGKVVTKDFVPQPETQLTIGAGGVRRRDLAGLYYLSVKANDTREIYRVLVDKDGFDRVQIGDSYQIPKASIIP